MSEQQATIVQRGIDAWNQRDLKTVMNGFRADAELDWSRSRGPLIGIYRGHDAIEAFWNEFFTLFEELRLVAHGFIEAGSLVVVPNTAYLRGREGIEVQARSALVYAFDKEGRVSSLRMHQEEAEALEAVGLRE